MLGKPTITLSAVLGLLAGAVPAGKRTQRPGPHLRRPGPDLVQRRSELQWVEQRAAARVLRKQRSRVGTAEPEAPSIA